MALNNIVKLTGNLGNDVKLIETSEKKFAVLSLATTDSYKDKTSGEWKDKETVWHEITVFNPTLIEKVSSFKKGLRVLIEGYLSYQPIEVLKDDGEKLKRKQASIVAFKAQEAPLQKRINERQI